jgi:hypothetical protein
MYIKICINVFIVLYKIQSCPYSCAFVILHYVSLLLHIAAKRYDVRIAEKRYDVRIAEKRYDVSLKYVHYLATLYLLLLQRLL